MTHRSSDSRHAGVMPGALVALGLALAAPTGIRAVPANPPAKSELGGAAAGASAPGPAAAKVTADDEIRGILRLGASLTDRGDFSTAEIAYWQILHRTDTTVTDQCSALLGMARMYRKENAPVKAAAIYERFIKDHPDEDRVPDALLDLGRTLRDMGAYRLAFGSFYSVINSTLKFSPQGFQHYEQLAHTAQFEIAQTHFEAGDYAVASEYFLKVHNLDLAPADRAHAQFMAACSQQLAGDQEMAVSTLRNFINDWPSNPDVPEARYRLATLLRQLKRPQEALSVTLQLLTGAHDADKRDPRLWAYWQRRTGNELANDFFQTGDVMDALAIYQGLGTLAPEPAWRMPVVYQIGLCYDRLGQIDQADAAYREVVAGGTAQAGAPAPTADLAELARMATWRLAHMQWRDKVEHDFTTIFHPGLAEPDPDAEKPAPAPTPSPAKPPAA